MTCRPGWSQSAIRIGARAGVVVTTSWLSATRRAGSGSARASMPRVVARSAAQAAALAGSRPQTRARANGRTRWAACELQPGLHAGAEDAGGLDLGRGQVAGGDGAGGGGADVGQVAVVEEERLRRGRSVAENRIIRPLRLGRPRLGLSKKPGLTLIAKPSKPGM